jgi:hypothetical protein
MVQISKPKFLRHFVSGFALGAMCLVGTQVAQADAAATQPVQTATR